MLINSKNYKLMSNRLFFITLIILRLTTHDSLFINLPLNLREFVENKEHQMDFIKDLRQAGAKGVIADVWWSEVETEPEIYDFSTYSKLLSLAKHQEFKIQFILSFHRSSSNEFILDLPSWIMDRKQDGFFFKDLNGTQSTDYISFFADNSRVFPVSSNSSKLRTPLEMYQKFGSMFKNEFQDDIGEDKTITKIIVGVGPHGQMRYPTYREKQTDFCHTGNFQIFDQNALNEIITSKNHETKQELSFSDEILKIKFTDQFREKKCSSNNSLKEDCGFITISEKECKSMGCCWTQNYTFNNEPRCFYPNSSTDNKIIQWYHETLVNHTENLMKIYRDIFPSEKLYIKVPSIHWFSNTNSRIAEITSGLLNGQSNDYDYLFELVKKYDFGIVFGGLGIPANSYCKSEPKKKLHLFKHLAEYYEVELIGENVHSLNKSNISQIQVEGRDLDGVSILRVTPELSSLSSQLHSIISKVTTTRAPKEKKIKKRIIFIEKVSCSQCVSYLTNLM